MNRKIEIIHLLLDANQPLTTTQISEQLHVSSRTIRSDLEDIEAEILAHHCKLVKKPRVGIGIEGSAQNKNQLYLDVTGTTRSLTESYSKESRRSFMLSRLLLGKSRMYLEYFAQTLYTSKSTIEKDLVFIGEWLNQHHLQLKRKDNQGIYISGREIDIRNAFAILVSEMQEQHCAVESMLEEYVAIDVKKIQRCITRWVASFQLNLGDANIKNLAFHIAIMIGRVQQKKEIQMTRLMEAQILELRNRDVIQELISQLEKVTEISLPDREIDYILLHLIGMTLDTNVLLKDDDMILKLKAVAEEITDEFLTNIEQIVCLGLPNNLSLRESLILHLLPTIYRLKYGLNLYNPLLHEIKEQYASAFALASIINSSFKKRLGVLAGDEEIAFIALHVSLAIEKTKEKPSIAVVCPIGRGISRFLLIKLEENFPQVNFLNYSLKDITQTSIPYVDMVISTIPISSMDKPCITISAILSDEDIRAIKAMIRSFENKNKKYFSLQTILVKHECIEKTAILKELANRLQICNYVDQTFLDGVIKRETMGSTEIGNGIVLTHGFHESVKRSQIAFCKLEEPVLWNTQLVSFIVMMAIEKNDAKNVMQMDWLYKTLNNDKVIQQIMVSQSEQELYELLIQEHEKY